MRSVFNRVIIALLPVTMTSVAAFAKARKTTVVMDKISSVGVAFEGSDQNIVVSDSRMEAGGND